MFATCRAAILSEVSKVYTVKILENIEKVKDESRKRFAKRLLWNYGRRFSRKVCYI